MVTPSSFSHGPPLNVTDPAAASINPTFTAFVFAELFFATVIVVPPTSERIVPSLRKLPYSEKLPLVVPVTVTLGPITSVFVA